MKKESMHRDMPQEIAEKIAVMMCYTEPKKFFNV